jgi:hypothetical protein
MSQHAVSLVIHALLVSQDLRDRFGISPMEVLVDLHLSTDIELTLDEVEALVQASSDIWRSTGGAIHARIH